MVEVQSTQVVVQFCFDFLITFWNILNIFHLPVRRTMREPNIQLILVCAQDMVAHVAVQVQIRASAEIEITASFIILDIRHDIA